MPRLKRQAIDYLQGEVVEVAPKGTLPSTSFVSVEFPAVLTEKAYPDDGSDEHPSLVKALESISPLPAGYVSAASALSHLGRIVGQENGREIECKLAQACDPTVQPGSTAIHPRTTNAIFRHSITGDVVEAHNVVCRVKKRIWKRKQPGRQEEVRKEYTVEALGVIRNVARFRTMPDYIYDPGSMVHPKRADEQEVAPSIALHDALRQMDIEGIRTFQMLEEDEKYDHPDELATEASDLQRKSNVRMPPPATFARTDVPLSYGFRQNPSSELRAVPGEFDDRGYPAMRYVNKQGFRDLAPIQFSMASASSHRKAVPKGPVDAVKNHPIQHPKLVQALKDAAKERPMWSRRTLLNRFKPDERRQLSNQRHLFSAVFYTITDGCWRDCLVRFGYDPRKDIESRFYQRLTFQRQVKPEQEQGRDTAAQQDDHSPTFERRSESPSTLQEHVAQDWDDRSHIFDGETYNTRTGGNFQLIDIEDRIVRELIYAEGDGVLGTELHPVAGWYTLAHYDKIRAVTNHRMSVLVQTGKPASRESCMAIINGT